MGNLLPEVEELAESLNNTLAFHSEEESFSTSCSGESSHPRQSTLNQMDNTGDAEGVGCTDSVRSLSSAEHDATSSYVWYASYASNMWNTRFMCYIHGGQVKGMAKSCIGARDKTPPVESCWLQVPHSLFFGHKQTGTWGAGGVAFLDPIPHGGAPSTFMHLYKITLEQLADVLIQENGGDPNRVSNSNLFLNWDHINQLRSGLPPSSHSTRDFLRDTWYGTIKYLGDKDGAPILTITCSLEAMQHFRNGRNALRSPSESYHTVILQGLMEHGLTAAESRAYLDSKCQTLKETRLAA